jgi:diguanylate cyclase (GGDEF)-like protein
MYFEDKRLLRIMQGMLLSILSPVGLIALQLAWGQSVGQLLAEQAGIYLYMLVGTAAAFALFGYYVGNSEERLEDLAIHDGLTGLYNKRFFEARLPEEFARTCRHHRPLSLILLDLDQFRRVNERYGTAAGDHALRAVATALSRAARKDESVARVGGEKFCIILTDCSEKSARAAAERFLKAVRTLAVPAVNGELIRLTASAGVVSSDTTVGDERHLYTVAEAAIYRARKAGRDQLATV